MQEVNLQIYPSNSIPIYIIGISQLPIYLSHHTTFTISSVYLPLAVNQIL